jgi:hypothetical protein
VEVGLAYSAGVRLVDAVGAVALVHGRHVGADAVICESSEATAADKNSLHRFADQIGLTTAGLAEMGWKVAPDELAARAASHCR